MEYVVQSGDSLSRIARRHGVSSWGTLYNAPENSEFRKLRPDPNRIQPGDRLYIPEQKTPSAKEAAITRPSKGVPKAIRPPVGAVSTRGNAVVFKAVTDTAAAANRAVPDQLTAGEVLSGRATYPDAFLNFLGEICGARRFQLNEAVEAAEMARAQADRMRGRSSAIVHRAADTLQSGDGLIRKAVNTADAAEGVCLLYRAWRGWTTGGAPVQCMCDTLKGLSKFWNFIPASARHAAVQSVAGIIGRVDKLRPLAHIVREFEQMGALPDLLAFLASIVSLSPEGAAADFKNIVHHLSRNKHTATRIAPDLMAFAVGLIPVHMRAKLLAKAGARKVPVVGTAIMAVSDIVEIVSAHLEDDDPKANPGHNYLLASKYAGLGSTFAGLIPGFGTAASVVADFIGVMLVAIGELRNLQVQITPLR